MPDPTPVAATAERARAADRARGSVTTLLLLASVLVLAGSVRLFQLDWRGYFVDELWTAELATGRGSAHLHIPRNIVVATPPELVSLEGAPPWWRVWRRMECTHPPLYFVLLRLWMQL